MSKGHGLSVDLSEEFLFDPQNEEELVSKILWLFNKDNYKSSVQKISSLDLNQTWEMVTDFHLNLIKSILNK
jgi:hypothetical protein